MRAPARISATTFGALRDQPQNVAPSISASVRTALPSDAIAKSTIAPLAMVADTVRVAITI
jgi:hypothetical protein